MINIAADSQIPEIENRLAEFFDDDYSFKSFDSSIVSSSDFKNIDALLVRSTLFIDEGICADTRIRYVGSATAGINHLDIDYLDAQNISWSHAPGCNAFSVIHYVMAAIGELIKDGLFNTSQSIGIVGYGNIGRRLYKILKALNFEVYACDPFLSHSELVNLDSILECDLITIHAPLTEADKHPTFNLINESHIHKVSNKILINTSRGEIISEALVLQAHDLIYVFDVWTNEPNPSKEIIEKAYIATPHIAGYSIEGKLNGAISVSRACAKFFNCLKEDLMLIDDLSVWPHGIGQIINDLKNFSFPIAIFKSELDLKGISNIFKSISLEETSSHFTNLRLNHAPRHDFNIYSFQEIMKMDQSIDMNFFNALKENP